MAHKIAILNGKAPNAGNGGVSDADLSYVAVNFLTSGVLTALGYQVQQQATPDMTVKVKAGKALVPNASGSMLYLTHLDTDATVTIPANASGNPRKDAVVIKINLAATPNEYADNVATLVAVQGTPGVSPVAPTDNEIQTAVGAGNPFLRLANVDVANGAVSITDANISDQRARVKAKLGEAALQFPDADGANGQALKTDGNGNLSFGDVTGSFKGARVYNSANISIPDNANTALTFDSERFDTDTIHDTGSNTGRLTCKTAGKYLIGANVQFANNSTGFRDMRIRLNGTTEIAFWRDGANSGTQKLMNVSTVWDMAVNDYVEVIVYQNSGGALNIETNPGCSPEFWMAKID